MVSSGEDVEQLLASRAATPIAQLHPDLTEQATRKIHGEITITWPYSSVSKSFAFLLAEPDFRLRRNKGLVRIQLKGPSADVIGKWELGSGDEVTVGLDGVEWAKDDEPARPVGSRSEWQLNFAGKLTLKAKLGETQETKFINIDQPVPIEPPEAPSPVHFAEIDLTVFDGPPAVEKSPAPHSPPAPNNNEEYASPMFMKRSRASYGPLFELDLDDELEDDGGRKGKGRKRPRYSALNGIWTLNEDNDSPDPEQTENTPAAVQEQDGDVEMHDTPSRPGMADGGVQTNASDLAPVPSSPANTPSKTWGGPDTWSSSEMGMPRPHDAAETDSGIQSSIFRPAVPTPTEHREASTTQLAPNPLGPTSEPLGFAGFGAPQRHLQNQGFGNASSLFGTTSTASSSQGFGQAPSLAGTASNGMPSHGFGHTASPFGDASNITAAQELGQGTSLFGMGSTPAQPPFSSSANANTGHGFTNGSLRFGFGQESQSTFGEAPFGTAQATLQTPADPYPELSLDQQEPSDYPSGASHISFGIEIDNSLGGHGLGAHEGQAAPKDQTPGQHVSLWPIGTQTFDSSHAFGRINASEDVCSDGSDADRTPPGMIPAAVEDGTRNVDEMSQGAIMSQPVYRQGVPQDALPDQENASAGEEDDSIDSDERADYDAAEKGDDYDLRNYDRVSDDEEDFEDEEPLSDDELLDEGSEHWAGEEAGYEEDDYDEDDEDNEEGNLYFQAPRLLTQSQLPPQPAVQKEKVVIDLLSDSDDDDSPAPPVKAPSSQPQMLEVPSLHQNDFAGLSKNELVDVHDDGVAQQEPELSPHRFSPQDDRADQEGTDSDEEAKSFDDENDEFSGEQQYEDNENASKPEPEPDPGSELVESDEEEVEADVQQAIRVNETNETYRQPLSVDGAMYVDDEQQDNLAEDEDEEAQSNEIVTANALSGTDQQHGGDSGNNAMAVDDDQGDNPAGSFQTQPDEILASFQFQVTGVSSHSQSPKRHGPSDPGREDGTGQEDMHSEGNQETRQSAPESENLEGGLENDGSKEQLRGDGEPFAVDLEKDGLGVAAGEGTEVETQETRRAATPSKQKQQQDEASTSSMLQHQDPDASAVAVFMTILSSQAETQTSKQQVNFETKEAELKAELVQMDVDLEEDRDRESAAEENDVEMADAGLAGEDAEVMEQADNPQPPLDHDIERGEGVQNSPQENVQEAPLEETSTGSLPQVPADVQFDQSADEMRRIFAQSQDTHSEDGGDPRSSPGMNEQSETSPATRHDDSFVSLDSQVSEPPDAEEAETAPAEKLKRGGRKPRITSSSKSAKSVSASQKAQRQSSRQSLRQVSAQQALTSQRTTRSKTMSFQAASPKEDKEDMSIQLARAALKSPSSKPRKVSATAAAAKRLNTDLVKQLEDDLPDCVSLSDLRKYNANFVDVAVVATSPNVPPKRTPTREYASSFTITDPSIAPDGVVEVDLYSLHKDHLPVVKTGDSVLLRGFLVVSLPARGFGLKTKDGSAWAVFKAEGGDEPEMKAATVEMSDKETKFMLGLRTWYAGLDHAIKGGLVEAVGEMVKTGKESRAVK